MFMNRINTEIRKNLSLHKEQKGVQILGFETAMAECI